MLKYVTSISIIIILLAIMPYAYGEKSTELYIPIGQSPGMSGKYTVMGKINGVNLQNQTLTMSDSSDSYTVKLAQDTIIYLDKSKVKLTNAYGALADCKVGDTVEVKFKDNARRKPAEWIKVEKSR